MLKNNLSLEEANYWEEYYIKYFHTWIEDPLCNGYNLRSGGNNSLLSEETKIKISEKKKGNKNYNYGKHLSDDTKKLLSEIMKTKWQDEEFKQMMIESRKGCHLSEETKRKISEANKGKIRSEQHRQNISKARKGKGGRRVRCINTGQIFDTLASAAEWCGLSDASTISKCCRNIRNTTGRHPITKEHLMWEYVE